MTKAFMIHEYTHVGEAWKSLTGEEKGGVSLEIDFNNNRTKWLAWTCSPDGSNYLSAYLTSFSKAMKWITEHRIKDRTEYSPDESSDDAEALLAGLEDL